MARVRLPRLRNRWRITGYILVTVLAVTAVAGTFAVQAVEREFTSRIDDELQREARSTVAALDVIDPDLLERLTAQPGFGISSRASIVLGPDGTELAIPSGTVEDPDPLPDLSARPLAQLRASAGPFEVPSADGSVEYRILATPLEDGRILVLAQPLDERDEAINVLIQILLVAAVVSTAVLTVTVSLVAGYITRPLDAMIDTATEIGAGDLRARVPTDGVDDVARLATALNAMLDRLQHAFADKDASEETMRRFVADASHELRTPLAAVLGYAELHQQKMIVSPEQVDHAMDRIAAEGERMRLLVEELLLLARLDQERVPQRERVDLASLVEVAVRDARAIDPDRPVELRTPPHPAVALGDPTTIRQAVDNLLANTRAHTPTGTPVRVTVTATDHPATDHPATDHPAGAEHQAGVGPTGAEPTSGRVDQDHESTTGGTVSVVVADAGPGMAPADAERAFDRFFRAERSRARPGGSGLGLSIVAAIAEAHRGSVSVETTPGGGATFALSLPAAPDGAGPPAPEHQVTTKATTKETRARS